jgi:HK97 family phage major capsid protein
MAPTPKRPPLAPLPPLPPPINRDLEDRFADAVTKKLRELFSPPPTIEDRRARAEARAAAGEFHSGADYLRELIKHNLTGETDARLARLIRAPSGGSEVDPTSGGFAVATVFSDDVEQSVYAAADVLPFVRRIETGRPADWQFPIIDETSRADGSRSGGAQSYWIAEGVTPPSTWPRVGALKLTASKLAAVCQVSNELLRDTPVLYDFLTKTLGAEMAFQIDRAIVKGAGAGLPLGVVNSPAAIAVPKQNGQATGTIVAENVRDAWSRLAAPCRKNAIWFANEDFEGQAESFNSASSAALYMPQGVNGNPYPLLKGRPLLYSEACSPLGTPGDLIVFDPTEYVLIDGGFKSSLSLDVSFTTDQAYFKMTWRGAGMPTRVAPVTPANNTATRSPYVTIAQR